MLPSYVEDCYQRVCIYKRGFWPCIAVSTVAEAFTLLHLFSVVSHWIKRKDCTAHTEPVPSTMIRFLGRLRARGFLTFVRAEDVSFVAQLMALYL